ncbi:MAG: TIGR04141 family sporadically distributed protein [Flavobacteriaceae bacterium]|nr:TIGR04141 family sporadically distributed protein [Flavobacteriaceae bacterium]
MKVDIKIFQINSDQYEIRSLSNKEKVLFIINQHREGIKEKIVTSIDEFERDNTDYISYQFSEEQKKSIWEGFFPDDLTSTVDYSVKQFSFVLFAINNNYIYCIVGGVGMQVVRKFLNDRFGIETYEYISKPSEDIVVSLTSRGITGHLTEQRELYRKNQTLFDALDLTNIPVKINIEIRDELKKGYFNFISFRNGKSYLDIGTYFGIKVKLNFEEFHYLIELLNEIFNHNIPKQLTSFQRIKDFNFIENILQEQLFLDLKNEINETFSPTRGAVPYSMDIDFIHPTKTIEFYECDSYDIKSKMEKDPILRTTDKNIIYQECLRYIYETVQNLNNKIELQKVINGIRIRGYKKGELVTQAMFLNHINTEIKVENNSYFKIDNYWYKIESNFISKINELCFETYMTNRSMRDLLPHKWDSKLQDEDAYNTSYNGLKNYYVFDKVFSDNIELCDIMYESENTIYLIHVKNGFDAKIRDLSNQVLVASNRLWHDLKNFRKSDFLEKIVDEYNLKNDENLIDKEEFVLKFKGRKNIVFVMAFKTPRKRYNLKERFNKAISNIAKYTIVQSKKEISKYPLQYFDITENDEK